MFHFFSYFMVKLTFLLKKMTLTRKEEILQTTSDLFNLKGFAAVSMRDIAKEVGIKPASIYHHVASKQEILSEIIMSIAQEFMNGIEKISNSTQTPITKLEAIIDLHVDLSIKYLSGMGCLNSEWIHLDDVNRKSFINMRGEYEERFRYIIVEGIKNGSLNDHNVEAILFSILSTLRNLFVWHIRKDKMKPSELKKQMKLILLKGIVKQPVIMLDKRCEI